MANAGLGWLSPKLSNAILRSLRVKLNSISRLMNKSFRGSTSASSVRASNMDIPKYWYCYLLLCDQKTFYVGITDHLKNRLNSHKNKESFFTKKFSDLKLVYSEKYILKTDAAKREKQWKGWSRTKKQMLIDGKLGMNSLSRAELVEVLS